jgi:hypothetical protein
VSQTLAAEQADLDLGLVQPAAVPGRVMRSEPVPDPATNLLSERVCECFTAVRTQVIQDQVDGLNVAAVALANKLARIAWAILATNQPYRPAALTGAVGA